MAFNLSKNNDPVPVPKKNTWVVAVLVAVIVGVAIWYFIPKKDIAPVDVAAPAFTPTPTSTPATVPDTMAISPTPPSLVAASFSKGAAAPISIADEVVDKIKQAHKITIYGYASSEGDLAVNLKLAQQRAESFKQYLISKGVDASTITVEGKGIENPIASNDTETGRTKNRRVEVSIE